MGVDRRFDTLARGPTSSTSSSSIPPMALGKLTREVAALHGQLAAMQRTLTAGLAEVTAEAARAAASMRPKFESLNSEITDVRGRAALTGKGVHALIQEKRGKERLRRKLLLAVFLGCAGTIGAGVGALALRSCAAFGPAPPHEAKP